MKKCGELVFEELSDEKSREHFSGLVCYEKGGATKDEDDWI